MNCGEVRVADDLDFEELKKLCDIHDGWTMAYNHSPTSVWTKPAKDSSFHMIKVLTVYNDVPSSVLYDVLHDPQYRSVWDKHMIRSVDVGRLNPNNDVSYYAISCPPPLKNRDFVLQRSWLDTGTELFVLNHSVAHTQFPPTKRFVRGLSYITGYLIRPLPSGGCSFSYASHSDPRGKLPPWVVNKLTHVFAPKMVKSLHKACRDYTAWKENNNPHFKPWIYPEQMLTVPRIAINQCQSASDDVPPEERGAEERREEDRGGEKREEEEREDPLPLHSSPPVKSKKGWKKKFPSVKKELPKVDKEAKTKKASEKEKEEVKKESKSGKESVKKKDRK